MLATWGSSSGGFAARFPSLAAWYRFGVGITSNAGAVSQWDDQSGVGHHLVQATGANQPALQGDNTILFDGTSDFLQVASFGLVQPETVYFLGKQVSWTAADSFYDGTVVNSGRVSQQVASPRIDFTAGTNIPGTSNLPVGTYGALAVVFNGAGSLMQLNSDAPITGNAGASNMGGFTLGARADGLTQGNIQVKEVIIYGAAHDQATRDAIIGYLNSL